MSMNPITDLIFKRLHLQCMIGEKTRTGGLGSFQQYHICPNLCNIDRDVIITWIITGFGKSVHRAVWKGLLALSGMSYKWLSHWVGLATQPKAATCLAHISSSTVWIPVKFGIDGKVFSRRIQRRMLRRTRITLYGKRRQLPKLRHSDHSRDIGSYHIRTSPSWTFPLLPRTFSFSLAPIWMRYRSIWGRNMTFTSRNARAWVLLWWNGLVGLSFHL